MITFDLTEVKARNIPRMAWRDVISPKEESQVTPEVDKVLTEYFGGFLNAGQECIGCKQVPYLKWEIQRGEASCLCGYPYRVYHQSVGPIKFLNLGLAYHANELELVQK